MTESSPWGELPDEQYFMLVEVFDELELSGSLDDGDLQTIIDDIHKRLCNTCALSYPLKGDERKSLYLEAFKWLIDVDDPSLREPIRDQLLEQFPDEHDVIKWAWATNETIIEASDTLVEGCDESSNDDISRPDVPAEKFEFSENEPPFVGGFGVVHKAHHKGFDKPVVIKVLRGKWIGRKDVRKQFISEGKKLIEVDHEYIRKVHDVDFTDDGAPYLVLEYVEGCSLEERLTNLTNSNKLDVKEAIQFSIKVAEALKEAHKKRVFHRDLKPLNILLGRGEFEIPKIIDFGLAISSGERMEKDGEIAGTPEYMAPEQLAGDVANLDGGVDIWALGVIMFQMLTGTLPFQEKNKRDLIKRIVELQHSSVCQLRPELSSAIDEFFNTCFSKDPINRFPSMQKMIDALEKLIEDVANPSPVQGINSPVVVNNVINIDQSSSDALGTTSINRGELSGKLQPRPLEIEPLVCDEFQNFQTQYYLEREDKTRELTSALENHGMAALVGMQGCGKTLAAATFGSNADQKYRYRIWLNAETVNDLIGDLAALAVEKKIDVPVLDDQNDLAKIVLRRLSELSNWLIVYDNVDNFGMVRKWLPSDLSKGHVLFTAVAKRNIDSLPKRCPAVELKCFTEEDGAYFLLTRVGQKEPFTQDDVQLAQEISDFLGGLPLALEQAGAYIADADAPITLKKYFGLYKDNADELMDEGEGVATEHESVAVTFRMAIKRLEDEGAAGAVDLLKLCAFLAPNDIPINAFLNAPDSSNGELSILQSELLMQKAIRAAARLALVQTAEESSVLSMHRLVQLVQRSSLTKSECAEWVDRSTEILNTLWPEFVEHDDLNDCESLSTHTLTIIECAEEMKHPTIGLACLMESLADYWNGKVRYDEAEEIAIKSISMLEELSGNETTEYAEASTTLGEIYVSQLRFQEARKSFEIAKNIYDEQCITKSHVYANLLSGLGNSFRDCGQFSEAEDFFKRSLKVISHVVGEDVPSYASRLNDLGLLYQDEGVRRYKESEELFKEALRIIKKSNREDSLIYANVVNNLALTHLGRKRYIKAEETFKDALRIIRDSVGEDDPSYANTLNNLGYLYLDRNRFNEAEEHFILSLETTEQVLGKEHVSYAIGLNDLGLLYQNEGVRKYKEAEDYLKEALDIFKEQIGEGHPRYAASLNNLALTYLEMMRYEEAEKLLEKALSVFEKEFGEVHPNHVSCLKSLTALYEGWSEWCIKSRNWNLAMEVNKKWTNSLRRLPPSESKDVKLSVATFRPDTIRREREKFAND